MTEDATKILALIPKQMQPQMEELESAVTGPLTCCHDMLTLEQHLGRVAYAVVLLPAPLLSQEWWNVWRVINTLEQRPSILIYVLHSDFRTWSGILEAGCFDIVVAPFTHQKLRAAISAAANDFNVRMKS
jgi:AmiR/NasT family two-component response regulator